MSERIWEEFLTEEEKKVFAAAGYGAAAGFGERPALLVIDVGYGFTGEKNEPILESIKDLAEFLRPVRLARDPA